MFDKIITFGLIGIAIVSVVQCVQILVEIAKLTT